MSIQSIQYENQYQTIVIITLSDGNTITSMLDTDTPAKNYIDNWIAGGNQIAPYAPPLIIPPAEDNIDVIPLHIKALGLVMAQWSGKTTAELKADFKQAVRTLKGLV